MKKELLFDMFNAALSALHPGQAVARTLRREGNRLHVAGAMYDLDSFDRVVVIGAGTAAAQMAASVEELLGDVIDSGTVVVKYGHTAGLRIIEQVEAGHPVPDSAGIFGTRKILDPLRSVDAGTLVICLFSGGASSLLVNPVPGISLEDKQKATDLLLRTGASVYEMNTVLKHLSGVKGGRLARAAHPATVLTLTLSDIVGDRIDVIASGPMTPGNSTFCEAAQIVHRYNLRYKLPSAVVALIERGTRGQEPETAMSSEACFRKTKNVIVGGMAQALFSAGNKARESGYAVELALSEPRTPVRQTARALAKKALRIRDVLNAGERCCLLFGGESAGATVRRDGRSGRNQELALTFAQEIAGIGGVTMLSARTDGMDGSTEAAGAVVNGTTTWRARERGIHPQSSLDNNDSPAFFRQLESSHGGLCRLVTGPTGAAVMDLQIILVGG